MIVYKLTTQDNKTRKGEFNECVWGPGVTHSGTGSGQLCSAGYIHAYLSPALAMLLNPIHANIPNPKLWECSVSSITLSDNDLKVGSVSLTTEREVEAPQVTTQQRVIFALLCAERAQEVAAPLFSGDKPWQVKYREKIGIFNEWKAKYLAGDTSASAAYAAARAARAAYAAYAAYAAADAAARAAGAAARAADAAARAAGAAARAAGAAADAAADAGAADYAARATPTEIDFVEIAARAITYSG